MFFCFFCFKAEKARGPTPLSPVQGFGPESIRIRAESARAGVGLWGIKLKTVTEKTLFQVILGLLLLGISVCRLRERGRMSKARS